MIQNNNTAKCSSRVRVSRSRIRHLQTLTIIRYSNPGRVEVLHHRHSRMVKVSHDPKPMTTILNIRRRGSIFSPLDPIHSSNTFPPSYRSAQCGPLVRIGSSPQAATLPVNLPVNLRILKSPSA